LQQTKQKKIEIKSKDTPRKCIEYEAIKYSVLKDDLIFADEEGVPRGHPQALMLVPLGYFLG
jgi:hypothetical protein